MFKLLFSSLKYEHTVLASAGFLVCVGGFLFVCFLVERSVCFKLDTKSFRRPLLLPCLLSHPASYQQHLVSSLPGFREMGEKSRAVAKRETAFPELCSGPASSKRGPPSPNPWVFGVNSKSAL